MNLCQERRGGNGVSEGELGLGMQSGPDLFLPLTTLIYHFRGVGCAEGVASHMTADSLNSLYLL